jgi:hypothetical protein
MHSYHTDVFEVICCLGCQEGNKFLHLFRPAGHTCRRRCRTSRAMWYWIVVVSFYTAINCGAQNVDTRLFPFEFQRTAFIAVTCICAVINHRSKDQWQCLMQSQTRATDCAHSCAADVLFKVNRCYLSARMFCSCIPFKQEVVRNKIGRLTVVS